MITTTHNAAGEVVGVTIDSTTYSEAALLTLLARLQRAEAEREQLRATLGLRDAIIADLRAQVTGLLDLLGRPSLPRLEPDDYAGIARLSE